MQGFRLAYLHFTVIHSKGQGQCRAHFASEYLQNRDRYGKHYYGQQIVSQVYGLSMTVLVFDLDLF